MDSNSFEKENKVWRLVTLVCDNSDEMATVAIELGATGAEIKDNTTVAASLWSTKAELEYFIKLASTFGLNEVKTEEIENQNWVQNCREIWQPITVGKLEIIPILDAQARAPQRHTLQIVPGLGFGTGHHESTRQALTLLQNSKIGNPKTALDVGTGNGILAIAFAKLFSGHASALDIDPDAIENARQNLNLNPDIINFVTLNTGPLDSSYGKYDLIFANIFAEVIAAHEGAFSTHLKPGGHIIMAGVTDYRFNEVTESYLSPKWQLLEKLEENGWLGLLYQLVS